LLPPSSPSPVLGLRAKNLLDVLDPGCLLPSPFLPPLSFCSVFVPGGDLWCVAFVNLTVLLLGMGGDFGGFHPNFPPGFLVSCSSPIFSTRYAAHHLLLNLPRAPYHDGFPASWRSASQPSIHWFRAYLASPPCRASFVPYRCRSPMCAQSAFLLVVFPLYRFVALFYFLVLFYFLLLLVIMLWPLWFIWISFGPDLYVVDVHDTLAFGLMRKNGLDCCVVDECVSWLSNQEG
jgi:hypothetical protein